MDIMKQAVWDRNELRMQKLISGPTLSFASLITAQMLCRFGQVSAAAAEDFQRRADRAFDPASGMQRIGAGANWGEINIKGLMAQQLLALEQVGLRAMEGAGIFAVLSGPGLRAETAMQMLERAGALHPELKEKNEAWFQDVRRDVAMTKDSAAAIMRGLEAFGSRRTEAFRAEFLKYSEEERCRRYRAAYQEAVSCSADAVLPEGLDAELAGFEAHIIGNVKKQEAAEHMEPQTLQNERKPLRGFRGLLAELGIRRADSAEKHAASVYGYGKERQRGL